MKNSSHKRLKIILPLLIVFFLVGYLLIQNIQSFLSPNEPVQAQILVIEGWLPDYALKSVANKISSNHYDLVITVGGPLKRGSFLSQYKTVANLAKSTLEKILEKTNIVAVPAPFIKKDRTYVSALALKKWLQKNHIAYSKINVATLDVHARRSWVIFQKALGNNYSIGIIAIDDIYYDKNNWWSSSHGFRSIVDETIAYVYVKIIFPFSDESSPQVISYGID